MGLGAIGRFGGQKTHSFIQQILACVLVGILGERHAAVSEIDKTELMPSWSLHSIEGSQALYVNR